ncbi:MAG: polymer-forming cytoskeletal protein [Chlorobi bacterium]|nr:polymer-forming cytoskeletal protein [Chlorobiota bacterium]
MGKYNGNENNVVVNFITAGTEITGDITSNEGIRIEGTLTGNLITKGKVVIGESGKVKGEVSCKNSEVFGTIEGKIVVSELLSLRKTARINGDISTNKLAIEPGSKFTGNCNMSNDTASTSFRKEIKPEPPKAEEKQKSA